METQRMLDRLTDHLAIYHRSSVTRAAQTTARQAVVEWMIGLNQRQRRAALTVVDASWVAIVLMMQKHLRAGGTCYFFLLPDVPGTDPGDTYQSSKASGDGKGKLTKTVQGKGRRSKLVGAQGAGAFSSTGSGAGQDTRCSSPLPELCFRRTRGLVERLETKQTAGKQLLNSILLFSSRDGVCNVRACYPEMMDCITVTEDFIENMATFLEVMDEVSHYEFLNCPCPSTASPWEEMPWLKAMGYYSLPAFIANKFEFGLWAAWSRAQGMKKLPRSLALKSRDTKNARNARACSCDQHGNAAFASNIFERKQACIDWWNTMGGKGRANLVNCALSLATKSEVLQVVGEARAASEKAKVSKSTCKTELMDLCGTRLRSALRTTLSDSEVEEHVNLGLRYTQGAAVAPYFAGLQALKQLSESGLLCTKFEGTKSVQEVDASWPFDSTFKSVDTLSDRIMRKVRNVLFKARNDSVELELLGGDSGSVCKGHGVQTTKAKVSKSKKKRRKHKSSSKTEASKQEENSWSSRPNPLMGQGKDEAQIASAMIEAEGEGWSSGIVQAKSRSRSVSDGEQYLGLKGKNGTSKQKMDHEPSQQSSLDLEILDDDLAGSILENMSCSTEGLANSKSSGSDHGGFVPQHNRLDFVPSHETPYEVGVGSPGKLIPHESDEESSSSCANFNLGQQNSHNVLYPKSNKNTANVIDNDENPCDDFVSRMDPATGPYLSNSESHELLFPYCPTLAFNEEQPSKIRDCNVSVRNLRDSSKNLDSSNSDQIKGDGPVARIEAGKSSFLEKQIIDPNIRNVDSNSPVICFGSVDVALPDLQTATSLTVLAKPLVKPAALRPCRITNDEESIKVVDSQVMNRKIEGKALAAGPTAREDETSDVLPGIPSGPNGLQLPKTFKQLHHSRSGHRHCQEGLALKSSPHEWPGSPQFGYFGAYHQPTATDWLQLDVSRVWQQRVESPVISYRTAPVVRQQSAQPDSYTQRAFPSRNSNLVPIDRLPLVQPGYNKSPPVGYSIVAKEESGLNSRSMSDSFPFLSGYGEGESNDPGYNIDDLYNEDRLTYDTDADDYGMYRTGDFEDYDGYMMSEEEGEQYPADSVENSSADYNQIFGGGVMYWNASDYTGLGYSRPGSLSSEDSSWARHEADLSAVLDDIVYYQPPPQGSYSCKGSTNSNVASCTPSPPSSSSVPMSFEHLSPVASSNPRHCIPRSAGKELGKFGQLPSQGLITEEQSVGPRVPITLEVLEQIRGESSVQPRLRPIVVVRNSLSRQLSSGEALRLQEAKSPHIVPRSRRDHLPCQRKRPPSPVLRCVPPAPPPPPPSPVAGPRRRRGLMAARSGSSSPRHWGLVNWPYKDELEYCEGKTKGGSPEGLPTTAHRRGSITSTPPMHPLSGALLRERLVAIPPMSLEQEHPDASIPMKTTLLHSSNPAIHLGLTKLLSALHVEIEAFSWEVGAENRLRKPFINIAVKKVAHSLQVLWPRSRVNIFGSLATGLALPTSDVDLVVCLPPVRNLEPIKEAGILEGRNGIKETSLQHAARYLADQDWVKNDSMKTIENTPVPIIMMVAEFLPHQCGTEAEDTSYLFGSSIRTEMPEQRAKVKTAVGGQLSASATCGNNLVTENVKGLWGGKAARHLVHLDISFEAPSHTGLRTAELVRELVGQYPALSPMALVLKQFLADRSLDHPYTGGLSSYCLVLLITRFLQHQHHHGKPSSNQNLGKLLIDFLHFFGCVFDPRRMGIRIRGGGMYVSRDRCHDIDPLYIEDPLHPDNNVGRNCFRILQCVKAFADGYAVLEKKLYEVSNETEDLGKPTQRLELLQKILPCIMTK